MKFHNNKYIYIKKIRCMKEMISKKSYFKNWFLFHLLLRFNYYLTVII